MTPHTRFLIGSDQQDQLLDYRDHLRSKEKPYDIVYLTPLGDPPSDASISSEIAASEIKAGRLHLWSYASDILPWLKQCRAAANADRIAAFLREFENFIQIKIVGARDMTEQDELADLFTHSSDDMVLAGMKVILAGRKVRERLMESFVSAVREAAASKGWTVSSNLNEWWLNDRELIVGFDSDLSYSFAMGFERSEYNRVYYGVKRMEERQPVPALADGLAEQLGASDYADDKWPWSRYVSPTDPRFPYASDWRIAPEPWVALKNGSMCQTVIEQAGKIRDLLA